jgi:hypothetical protein
MKQEQLTQDLLNELKVISDKLEKTYLSNYAKVKLKDSIKIIESEIVLQD